MKVTCITTKMNPDNGVGRMSFEIVSRLRDRGIDCVVLVEQKSDRDGADGELLPRTSIIHILRNAWTARRVSRDSDCVHAFDAWPYALYGLCAVIGTKKQLFINGIGSYSLISNVSFLKRILLRRAYTRAACIFSGSEYTRAGIVRSVPNVNAIVLHLGHAPLPEVSSKDIENVRKQYGLEKYSPMVLTVGDVKNRKGQLETLKAVVSLKERFPSIGYVAVGSSVDERYAGAMREYAEVHRCSEILKVLTNVKSREEVSALFHMCSVYALNSNTVGDHTEGFGLSITEANGVGKLAVGSKGTGIEDAIRDGYNGILVPQRDTDAIAKAIEAILAEDSVAAAVRAKEYAGHFNWDRVIDTYISWYEGRSSKA